MWNNGNNLAQPLLTDTYPFQEQNITIFNPIMDRNMKHELELHRVGSNPLNDDSDDSDKSEESKEEEIVSDEDYEAIQASTSSTNPKPKLPITNVESNNEQRNIHRRTTAKVIINEDIILSHKYAKYLTLDNDSIIDKNDKIDALILQLKLAHIYTLPDDEQYAHILKCYSWIDDEDGDIDQFQYEILQEVVSNMTSIERRYMYDTIEKYNEDDSDIKLQYKLIPAQLKTMRRYKKMKTNKNNELKTYVCCGCGVLLKTNIHIKKKYKDKFDKYTKSWRGYICSKTGREFIFHNRLCVKFRKAKEWIRDAVYKYNIEHGIAKSSKLPIDFLKNEDLDLEFHPCKFYTTFDETQKKLTNYTRNIRSYYRECVNTDLRGYDIDEGDRFSNIPIEIKYLDQREFAIPMFKYLIREVQIKEFNLFWELIQFFASYIDTPKLILLLKESSDILFPLHDDTHTGESNENNELINFLTIICEGALYPIATCLYISAYIKENGESYWNEDETESLSKHFRNMASTIIDEIESEHLVAIVLETPTNIYDGNDDHEENDGQGLSVIDIAIKYKMLKFLQNNKISRIATTLWYERKIIHPKRRFGEELSYWDLFTRLYKTPGKFYFSQCGLNMVRGGLYAMYLILFSYVTLAKRYNYEQPGAARDSNYMLWLFNIAAILYESYRCFTTFHIYFQKLSNITEFIKSILWIIMFFMRWIFPTTLQKCLYYVKSEDPFYFDCGKDISAAVSNNNQSLNIECNKFVYREDPYDCSQAIIHNSLSVEIYMGLWALQCVLFWTSLVFYLQRSRSVGPLLRMIALMTQDMINFLLLVIIFWVAISLALYYVVSIDLDDDNAKLNGDITTCLFYGMLTFLGVQDWASVSNTGDIIGETRSLLLESIVCFASVIGSVLILNLLIAMFGSTFNEFSELSILQVNYTRIVQSYNASKDISLIPPPLNYFAFILMSIWVILDLLITACTGGTKMLNDWFFTPLNRTVFSAGDFIDYKNTNENGKNEKASGFVQHTYTSEVAEIQVADQRKFVHKKDILKIKKDILTERLKNDGNKTNILRSSGRYYCKYCRFLFHGDQVGNVEQIKNLFRYYGILLDDDDIGKLGHMLGENKKDSVVLSADNKLNDFDSNNNHDMDEYNKHLSLRKLGVAQLCPECYRPFYCSTDHFDEVQRLQYLSEVCSFWVFLIVCYVPLVSLFAIPAILSWFVNIIFNLNSSGDNNNNDAKLQKKIKMSENNDKYRALVTSCFDDIRPLNDYVNHITNRLNYIQKKIRESTADDEEDNIVVQTQEKLQLQKLVLTPKEGKKRMKQLKLLHKEWSIKLDNLISQIKKIKKIKKEKREKY